MRRIKVGLDDVSVQHEHCIQYLRIDVTDGAFLNVGSKLIISWNLRTLNLQMYISLHT